MHRELGLDEDVGRGADPGQAFAGQGADLAIVVEVGRADAGRAVVAAGRMEATFSRKGRRDLSRRLT